MPKLNRSETRNLTFSLGVATREDGSRVWNYDAMHTALLMDIRDELQKLNALLACPSFLGIPATLRTINRKIPARKKKARG